MMKFVDGELKPVECHIRIPMIDTTEYHKYNHGRASKAVTEYLKTHDFTNSPIISKADIYDLYGLVLDRTGELNIEALIELSIYAGVCASEWTTTLESEDGENDN